MKFLLMLMSILIVSGCASYQSEVEREYASVDPHCELEKHGSKDWYRFKMFDRPFNEHWYSENQAKKIYDRYTNEGRCK